MKELSKTKKIALNTVTKFVYQITTVIIGLILPRLIIQTYGSHYNGAVSSITQFLSISSILAMGIAGAMRSELYKTLANNDTEGTSKIVKCTRYSFNKIGKIFLLYSIVLAIFYPIFANSQVDWKDVLLLVIIISATTYFEYYLGQTYYYLLEADQSIYTITSIRTIVQIINAIIAIVLMQLGASIVLVKLSAAILLCAVPIIIKKYAYYKYGLNEKCELDKSLLKQRKASMFHSVANIVHDRTDILLLTLFTNFKTVSIYTVFYSVVGNIKTFMHNFLSGLESAFGSLWAKGEKKKYKEHFNTYEFIISCFVSIVFTCLIILLIPFIKLYTRGITDVNYILPIFAVLIVVAETIYCFRQPYVTAIQSVGHYKQTKNAALIEAGINIVVSTVLVAFFDLYGVIIGTIVANLYRTIHYGIYASKNIIERSFIVIVFRVLWAIINMAIVMVITNLFLQLHLIDSWGEWIINAIIVFAISSIVTLISALLFYNKDMKNTFKFIRSIFSK